MRPTTAPWRGTAAEAGAVALAATARAGLGPITRPALSTAMPQPSWTAANVVNRVLCIRGHFNCFGVDPVPISTVEGRSTGRCGFHAHWSSA